MSQKDNGVVEKNDNKQYNYIQQSNKFPLDVDKWGYIPEQIESILNIENIVCDRNPCLLRYGVEHNKKQSFLSAMASVYNYNILMHKDDNSKQPKHISLETFKEYLLNSFNLDIFNNLHNGNLVDIFSSTKNVSLDNKDYKDTKLYAKLYNKKENKTLQMIVNSYENFKKYIQSNDYINYTYLWDLLSTPNKNLFFGGLNIVILEITGTEETNNVKILCPTNYYSENKFDINNETCILIKYGDYYEPLYRFYDTNDTSITFPIYNSDDTQLSGFFLQIKELYNSKEKCLPFQLLETNNTYKEYTSNKIINILKSNQISILSQVIDIFGKVNGIVVKISDDNIQYIPCFPSNILNTYDIIFTGDFVFNDYDTTIKNLNELNKLTNQQLKSIISKKIIDTIKKKKYIVGLLTELNLFVPIKDIVENKEDSIPSETNKYVYIDKQLKINFANKNENISFDSNNLKSFIEIETLFYNRFKILIRNKLTSNKLLQGRIFDIIKSENLSYIDKQKKIYNEINTIINDIIIFTDEITIIECIQKANLIENKKTDCFKKSNKQLLPKENLVTKKNNKVVYTLKLIDEMIRTQHGLYFFEVSNKYFSYINNFNFEIHNNEIIVSQSELVDLFNEKKLLNKNYYNKRTSYEFSNPITKKKLNNSVKLNFNKNKNKYVDKQTIVGHKQTKKKRRPRCPKGMRRDRVTGICKDIIN